MADNKMDKSLEEALAEANSKGKIIKDDGSVKVPGTPLILPGRGVMPKGDEYLDSSMDSGVTKDTNKIESLKIKNQRDTIENALLGKFDGQGVYSVSDEISKELIEMVKIISVADKSDKEDEEFLETEDGKVKMLPGVIYVETVSEFGGVGRFNFAIQTYYKGNQTSSELFLLEDVKKADGFVQNINIYSVGKYTEAFGANYKRNMFRYFNIVSKELANKMSDEEKLLFGWAYRRKMYLKMLSQMGSSKYALAEANYLNAKIEALSGLGAYGATVLSMFNDLQERAKAILGKELSARDLNDLLDIILDDMASKYPEMTKIYHSTIHGATLAYASEIKMITEANVPAAEEKAKSLSNKNEGWKLNGKASKNMTLKPPKKKKEKKEDKKKENKKNNTTATSKPQVKATVQEVKPEVIKKETANKINGSLIDVAKRDNLASKNLSNDDDQKLEITKRENLSQQKKSNELELN